MRIASLSACWLLSVALPAMAQPAETDAYRAGLACFEQLDYACAIDLLTAAAYSQADPDPERWCDIHRKLAESQLALGRPDQAVEAFERLLARVPGYRIDLPGTSPKILAALDRARRKRAPSPVPSPSPAADGTGPVHLPLRLGLFGGAEFLVGQDSRLLEIGAVVDLELTYRYTQSWALGGGLRWTSHAVSGQDATVHLGGGWAGGGPSLAIGPLRLSGLFGLGVARFGIVGREGKTALFVPLRLAVDFLLHERILLGLGFSPSWLLSFGDFHSSLTFDLSAGLAVGF